MFISDLITQNFLLCAWTNPVNKRHAGSHSHGAWKPGSPERLDTEYERNGSNNIFLACEPLAGKRQITITKQRKKQIGQSL